MGESCPGGGSDSSRWCFAQGHIQNLPPSKVLTKDTNFFRPPPKLLRAHPKLYGSPTFQIGDMPHPKFLRRLVSITPPRYVAILFPMLLSLIYHCFCLVSCTMILCRKCVVLFSMGVGCFSIRVGGCVFLPSRVLKFY